MSTGWNNAGWISRLWSLAKPEAPHAEFVTNVNLVNDRRYASSRERAPYAMHAGTVGTGVAGIHGFVEVGAVDPLGPTLNSILRGLFEASASTSLTGFIRMAIADGAALTTATRVAGTPIASDRDPDIVPSLFTGTIATANLPTTVILPRTGAVGTTAATPNFRGVTELEPLEALPFALAWRGPSNLMFFGGDAEVVTFLLSWQGQRG